MMLKIAVHKRCKNKQNPDKVSKGWSNINESLDWLLGWVTHGYGWCATHFLNRHRKSDNAHGSNLIVIDFDGDTTLERFWESDTAKQWCAATYTSSSHTEQEHRFRALFPLEKALETISQHRGAYWLVVNRLLAELELEKLADNCGQKPERLWYGNTNAVVQKNPIAAFVPEFLLNDIDYEDRPTCSFSAADISDIDIQRCQWLLTDFLRPSEDGEYESYYVPVMASCAGIGEEMFDSWVVWLLTGHHGQKDENTKAFKWRGLGNYSGHTTIYSLAKKQNPHWTSCLPDHLKFGAIGSASGYTEFDPTPDLDQVINQLKGETNMEAVPNIEPIPAISLVKRRGRPKKGADDAAKERANDVESVKSVFRDLRKNELTGSIEYSTDTGQTIALQGNDLELMTTKLSCENGIFIPEQRVKAAIQYAAGRNSYCPIQKYLNYCAENYEPFENWDSIGKIYLGNDHLIATRTLQRMMIGAVARAFDPGCSMSWIPILVGAQGAGKSMFSRNLVPPGLFAEISTPLDTLMKEQYRMHVAWVLELPEIDHFFSARNIENFKNLITTRCDEVRYPYAALPSKLNRRFVLIGTTNRNQFLVDSTGNRRFIPLELSKGFQIPWRSLNEDRNSLWSAAVKAYRAGAVNEFDSGEIAQISDYIQQFGDPDPWMDKIASYVSIRQEVHIIDVLTTALELDPRQQGRKESRRVTDCLQTMGWRKFVTSRKDPVTGKAKSVRIWQRPKDDPLPEDHILKDF